MGPERAAERAASGWGNQSNGRQIASTVPKNGI